jgi:hypothetical protein
MSERERRAEQRRRQWVGGVAHGFAEAEAMDIAFWASASPAERVRGVTLLTAELRWTEGDDGSAPRLQRTVGGVRPRGR